MNSRSFFLFAQRASLLTALLAANVAGAVEPGDPLPAQFGDFQLKGELGLALPLTGPQATRFTLGGSEMLHALWTLTPWLDAGVSAGFTGLAGKGGTVAGTGTAVTFGAGLQLKRPHDMPDRELFFGASPWLDLDALYVRTGELNRAGFDVGAGLSFPIGERRAFWFGPYVRYLHVWQQPQRTGFDNSDAQILSFGLSLEMGGGIERQPEPPMQPQERIVTKEIVKETVKEVFKETFVCADRDKDTVPDNVDRCPDVAGPMDSFGCPVYAKVIVKDNKLELKDKLYFAWDSDVIAPASYPLLDDIVQAVKDSNPTTRVRIIGHTSSEGGPLHNQKLSERRSAAILNYLVTHGVAVDRLSSSGHGSSQPLGSNSTAAGRDKNRRVDFMLDVQTNDGTK